VSCVFDNDSLNLVAAIRKADEEKDLWELAKAKYLQLLTAPILGLP
jgi:hypothetical protein